MTGIFYGRKRSLAAIVWLMLALISTANAQAEKADAPRDFRTPFNKSGHRQTAWVHANPWWPPNKDRRDARGGPDVAMRRYPDGAAMWREVAKELEFYGINGIQLESSVNAPYYNVFRAVFEGFQAAGNQRKVVFFLGMFGNNLVADTVKFSPPCKRSYRIESLQTRWAPSHCHVFRQRTCPGKAAKVFAAVEKRNSAPNGLVDGCHERQTRSCCDASCLT